MNYIDIVLLLIMGICIWNNYQRGFIVSSLHIIAWIGSLLISFLFYELLNKLLLKVFLSLNYWAPPLSFMLILIFSRWGLDTLADRLLDNITQKKHDHIINKIAGIVPGIINGLIWAALLATFFMLMPLTQVSEKTRDSKLSEGLVTKVSWLESKVSPIFAEALNRTVRKTTLKEEGKSVKLPFIVKHPITRPELEKEMLAMVNRERKKVGLGLLKADPEIAVVARKHSADMFLRGYFSHYTPENVDPFGRMRKDKIRFLTAGENLALAQTLQIAHKELMESPGHRANILNPNFGRLGIGILDGGIYGLMITQNFRN
ncbi:hypothetical protein GCM10027049_13600 [Mucilaginibacter puniceus]